MELKKSLAVRIKLWQKNPLKFIKEVWNKTPQPCKAECINELRIAVKNYDLDKIKPELFGDFDKEKNVWKWVNFDKQRHVTWQQYKILLAVKASIEGKLVEKISIASGHGIGKQNLNSCLSVVYDNGVAKIKKWGDVQVGDYLYGTNGKPIEVTARYNHFNKDFYKIKFDDGSFTYASLDHLWNVRGRKHRRVDSKYPSDYWETLSTKELISGGVLHKNGYNSKGQPVYLKNWEIPTIEPLDFPEQKVYNPYAVGLWLGDGDSKSGSISSANEEVWVNLNIKPNKNTKRYKKDGLMVSSPVGLNQFLKKCKMNGVTSDTKFIADIYKFNSIENRKSLLAGLLDSDGECGKKGSVGYSSTSKKLVEDVIWLVRSLGGKAMMQPTEKKPFYYNDKGDKVYGKDCYRATLNLSFNPFRIKNKAKRYAVSEPRYLKRFIESIEFYKKGDGHCVTVDAENHLYLIDDFIPTHNSCTISWILIWYLFCFYNSQIGCTANSGDQLRDVLWKEVALWIDRMPKKFANRFEMTQNKLKIKGKGKFWFARAKTSRPEKPEALAGLHSDNMMLCVDEASGVSEKVFETAQAALTNEKPFYFMISNPTRLSGYFWKSHHINKDGWVNMQFNSLESPIVNWKFVRSIIDDYGEASPEYRVRVLGLFPKSDRMDDKGYVQLIPQSRVIEQQIPFVNLKGKCYLGVDPAGNGKNKSAFVTRDNFGAEISALLETSTAKQTAEEGIKLAKKYGVAARDIFVDSFGVGADVVKEFALAGYNVTSINVGDTADDSTRFMNKRAENYWRCREWIMQGSNLDINSNWSQLCDVRYKKDGKEKIKIETKIEMRRNGVESPDCADALMLTFTRKERLHNWQPTQQRASKILDYFKQIKRS